MRTSAIALESMVSSCDTIVRDDSGPGELASARSDTRSASEAKMTWPTHQNRNFDAPPSRARMRTSAIALESVVSSRETIVRDDSGPGEPASARSATTSEAPSTMQHPTYQNFKMHTGEAIGTRPHSKLVRFKQA
jgi:hypothetical protein